MNITFRPMEDVKRDLEALAKKWKDRCQRCDGSGFWHVLRVTRTCPECKGTGHTHYGVTMTQRELRPAEVAAMWLWGAEYAKGGLGAIEFYARLDASRKRNVADFLLQIAKASKPEPKKRKVSRV